MNILVTGSEGQLGREIRELAPHYATHRFYFAGKASLDITLADAVRSYLKSRQIDCIINCAAYTAVDKAETDVAGANLVNARGAGILASESARQGALMVQLSTDYVFDGKLHRPYTESDPANPRSVYGKSKLEGEVEVIFNARRSVIFRTSWLYSSLGHNFVNSVLSAAAHEKELRVVCDQAGTPTYAADLARAILDVIPKLPSRIRGEIYNYSNEGLASWYDFAKAILEIKGLNAAVHPIHTKELKQAAERPHYSVLSKTRIKKEFDLQIPYWRDSLKACLEKM